MAKLLSRVSFICGLLGTTSLAWSQSSLDRCNDILVQDMFNRVNTSSQSSTRAKETYTKYIFSLDTTKAYTEYLKAYDSSKKQNTTASGEGGYGFKYIEIKAGMTHAFERKLSETEFSKAFTEASEERVNSTNSSNSKDTSLISLYQSSVRDATSVKAWEQCMSRSPEPGLVAYGYRDENDNPYIKVLWAPGSFAGTAPTINVTLTTGEPGVSIARAGAPVEIATGTGTSFPITFIDNTGKIQPILKGFVILANGNLTALARTVASFTTEANIPDSAAEKKRASQCFNRPNYPLGKWNIRVVDATPADYANFINFTTPLTGIWGPPGGSAVFEISAIPSPGGSVTLKLHGGPTYLSTYKLMVLADGCSMEGAFSDNEGHRGGVSFTWVAGRP